MPGFGPIASGPVAALPSGGSPSIGEQQVTSITGYSQLGTPDATQQVAPITGYSQLGTPDATQQVAPITGYSQLGTPDATQQVVSITGYTMVAPATPKVRVTSSIMEVMYPLYAPPPAKVRVTSSVMEVMYSIEPPKPLNFTTNPYPPRRPALLKTINSYLYVQYNDDSDLQAFVASYNVLTQNYVDTFNGLNLPIYTQYPIVSDLLDWVGEGIYGIPRPVLTTGFPELIGPFNTYQFDANLPINGRKRSYSTDLFITDDDTYRRVITWNFYKGDGNQFSITWLKKRIMRFLFGTNGVGSNIDQAYRISVSFGYGDNVSIRIINNVRTLTSTTAFNTNAFNTKAFNAQTSTNTVYSRIPEARVLKAGIESGALALPFQYKFTVDNL